MLRSRHCHRLAAIGGLASCGNDQAGITFVDDAGTGGETSPILSSYNNPVAEVLLVPAAGGTKTRLAANDPRCA